jgi:two-component system nitrate/nitrite sensor histidine kinase NarX
VGLTLLMSWKLEGGAAAVNEMGSERMRSYRIALLASQAGLPGAERDQFDRALHAEITAFGRVLDDLEHDDPSRPLLMPRAPAILAKFDDLQGTWQASVRPGLERLLATSDAIAYLALEREFLSEIDRFVPQVDALVRAIEEDMASNTRILRGKATSTSTAA